MERKLRYVALGTNEITFADPLQVTRTTRFTHNLAQVTDVNVGRLTVNRAELISLRPVQLKKAGCEDTCSSSEQNISVRIKVSGPLDSSEAVKRQILDALENMKRAVHAQLTEGFLPTSLTEFVADAGITDGGA